MATQGRPRTKSMLSFTSHKSSGSTGKGAKIDLTESTKEKAHRRITSKADPSMAMREMQPVDTANAPTTIDSLRGIQHKDIHGNIITDPDRSNPTRPRLERPLDTIRSFEAAVDGSYNSKRSSAMMRPETRTGGYESRRSSYHPGYSNGGPNARYPPDGGYNPGFNAGGRAGPPRPDNYERASPALYGGNRRMSAANRNHSDPALYGNNSNGLYAHAPTNGYHQPYDAATTASGSGSYGTEPWANSTDPSSENSSIDKIPQQPPKPDLGEQYGFSGFGGGPEFRGPIMEETSNGAPSYGQPGYGQHVQNQNHNFHGPPPTQNGRQGGYGRQDADMPPPPPPHKQAPPATGRLQSTRTPSYDAAPTQPDQGEKRKSWLKRRFSKKD